jgi:hypothetical protein
VSDVWEPWRPEIGQRVRVRLSEECNLIGHAPAEDGAVGMHIEVGREGEPDCHIYAVRFDPPLTAPRRTIYATWYAAIELEPAHD